MFYFLESFLWNIGCLLAGKYSSGGCFEFGDLGLTSLFCLKTFEDMFEFETCCENLLEPKVDSVTFTSVVDLTKPCAGETTRLEPWLRWLKD